MRKICVKRCERAGGDSAERGVAMTGSNRQRQNRGVQGVGGLNGYVMPSRNVTVRRERQLLPNGRVIEYTYRSQTVLNDDCATTNEFVDYPYVDCGCSKPRKVTCCLNPRCRKTVCEKCWRYCRACGLKYCTACLKPKALHKQSVLMCRDCTMGLFAGLLRKLFG